MLGLSRGRKISQTSLIVVSTALLGLFTFPSGRAAAECAGGTVVGACTAGEIAFEGCCTAKAEVHWCDEGTLCQLDCKRNSDYPTNSCGQESSQGGCCDAEIMRCVCDIDPLCCDNQNGFGWDNFCVSEAVQFCGGVGQACDAPQTECGWNTEERFYDCVAEPRPDPTGQAPLMCGNACEPRCDGRTCGPDGCGGACGACEAGTTCSSVGQCTTGTCQPLCGNRQCGPDGCGGTCGQGCGDGVCNAQGRCEGDVCTPQCGGRECGPNGCGGNCGGCGNGEACSAEGMCKASTCTPSCSGRECGPDGCGGRCGACDSGARCDAAGQCDVVACVPDCDGKSCGDDGCGDSCGTCAVGETCEAGTDQCLTLTGKEDGVPPIKTPGGAVPQPAFGCATTGGPSGLWFGLFVMLMLVVRRRVAQPD